MFEDVHCQRVSLAFGCRLRYLMFEGYRLMLYLVERRRDGEDTIAENRRSALTDVDLLFQHILVAETTTVNGSIALE